MNLNKRAAKLVLAANLVCSKVQNDDDKKSESHEEKFDDDVTDTYRPVEDLVRLSSPDVLTGPRSCCEYENCSSEVFATYFQCNSFLCWYHFEDPAFANDCSKHSASSESLLQIQYNDLVVQPNKPSSGDNLRKDQSHNFVSVSENLTALVSPDSQEQTWSFFSVTCTCMSCRCFLCSLHFEDPVLSSDCTKHTPFLADTSVSQLITERIPKKESVKKATKRKRNNGLEYLNYKRQRVPAKSMKPPCDTKCRFKCFEKIKECERQQVFEQYWALGDITRQRDFIKYSTQAVNPNNKNQCDTCVTKQRAHNYAFYFEVNSTKIRVCKAFYKATLDINDRVIATVREKIAKSGFITEDLRGKHQKTRLVEEVQIVHEFINTIPRIESHYLRAQTTREYIEGGKSLTDLYVDYKLHCEANSAKSVSKTTFSNIFHKDFNISFFTPKKDRCELCVSYENSNDEEKLIMQEQYNKHLKEKKLSREEKSKDKEKTSGNYVVACYDLQAVLTSPRGEVSLFYYISKLATYNFTVAKLQTNLTTCFVWHEGQGNRGVTEIGSCVLKYLTKKSEEANIDDLQITFYSDNCCGQQKNKYMIALYLYAVKKLKIKTLTHKFLVKGHTQNEGDAVHSTIEKQIKRALKCDSIYSPQEYVSLIKTAKRNPPYYKVEELYHSDFQNIKVLCEQIGSNYNRTTNNETVKLTDFRIIEVRKDDPFAFYVKTSYADENFKRIEIKKHNTRKMFMFPDSLEEAYTEKIPINEKKKKDLMKLFEKNHIPKSHFNFYNGL